MPTPAPETPRPATRFGRWLTPLLLVLPIVVIFAPVLFTGRSLAFRDGAHFYHPLFQWIAAEWGAGRVPLWNPYENCGLPILADATSSIFYPPKLMFLLPLPFAYLYNLYIVGHVLLAALGMHALARRYGASQPAAVLVALAYALGGNVLFQFCNVVFLVGAAWLPAALLAIEEVVASRCWRAALFLAFVLAMMILGGDPQMAYHALLAAGLRVLCAWFGKDVAPTASTGPSLAVLAPRRSEVYPVVLLGGAACAAALLAAVQILPSSAATKSSERAAYDRPRNVYEATALLTSSSERSLLEESPSEAIVTGLFGQPEKTSHHDRAYDFSVSPWRLIEFIWPNVSGSVYPRPRNWIAQLPGGAKFWTPTLYLGLFPLLAGACALRLRRASPATRWLSWLVLIFTLASFGWYGLGWVAREVYASVLQGDSSKLGIGTPVGGVYWLMVTLLPTYVYFRYPAKLMVVAVCALCALAAPAADRWFAEGDEKLVRRLRWFAGFSVVIFVTVVLSAGIWLPLSRRLVGNPSYGPFDRWGAGFEIVSGLLHAAIVAWLLSWILRRHRRALADSASANTANAGATSAAAARWPWLAAALTASELVIANHGLIVTAPSSIWSTPGPIAQLIRATEAEQNPDRIGPPRVFRGSHHNWRADSFAQGWSSHRVAEQAQWEADTLFPKYHLVSQLPLVESYGSLKLLDYESLLWTARNLSSLQVNDARVPAAPVLRLVSSDYLLLPAAAKVSYADALTPAFDAVAPAAGASWPENASLWRMKRTQPRAWVVDQVVVLPPLPNPLDLPAVDQRSSDVLGTKIDGRFKFRDFARVAVVETEAKLLSELLESPPTETNASPPEVPCQLTIDTPQHVRISTRLARPGLLVLVDSWNEGWQAEIRPAAAAGAQPAKQATTEGAKIVPIHRANRCFRGVELPAGDWIVDFHFRPANFYRGAWISGLAWLGLVGIVGTDIARGMRKSCDKRGENLGIK